jgi:hypothetical protein
MAIKKLSETFIFQNYPEQFRKAILHIVQNQYVVANNIVSEKVFEEQLKGIAKRLNYPSKTKILNALADGHLKMVYLDTGFQVPNQIISWPVMGDDKKISVIVNLTLFATKDKASVIDIDMLKLFSLLQAGWVDLSITMHENKITTRVQFTKALCNVYTKMFKRCLDKLFSLNLSKTESDQAAFLIAKFFLIYVAGRPESEAIDSMAYSATSGDTPQATIMRLKDKIDPKAFYSLPDFVLLLSTVIPSLSELTVRSIIHEWMKMYSTPLMFGLEHYKTFATHVISAYTTSNLSRDSLMVTLAKKHIDDAYLEFNRIVPDKASTKTAVFSSMNK